MLQDGLPHTTSEWVGQESLAGAVKTAAIHVLFKSSLADLALEAVGIKSTPLSITLSVPIAAGLAYGAVKAYRDGRKNNEHSLYALSLLAAWRAGHEVFMMGYHLVTQG